MPVIPLERTLVPKIWGRKDLPLCFGKPHPREQKVGEVHYSSQEDLLVKYLFTSQKLSIQVHPGEGEAAPFMGKDEAWIVLEAEANARIGIGLKQQLSEGELRAAALDGHLEELMNWCSVQRGDVFYVPAGTIHALGAGLSVLELQQNADITYRLYDYGRARELQIDEGVAAANVRLSAIKCLSEEIEDGREVLVRHRKFVAEKWSSGSRVINQDADGLVWLIPLVGKSSAENISMELGEVYLSSGQTHLQIAAGSVLIVVYPGSNVKCFSAEAL